MDGQPALRFADWVLEGSRCPIARQYDDNSRVLLVEGDLPEGWSWTMLTACGDSLDLIALSPMEGGVGAVLTAEMLALAGWYRMQLRGAMGEQTRHTNVARVFIPDSLSGDAQWPELPSEFSQAEARVAAAAQAAAESQAAAAKAAEEAQDALDKAPKIQGGTWWVWDAAQGAYVDTGSAARGEGVPEHSRSDRGKSLIVGQDGGTEWDYETVDLDSDAYGIVWDLNADTSTVVSKECMGIIAEVLNAPRPLRVVATIGGVSSAIVMTELMVVEFPPLFVGYLYDPTGGALFAAMMRVDLASSTVMTGIRPITTRGADGVTFTPSVSAAGVISWSNDGNRPNPSPVDIKGPPGAKGDPGPATVVSAGRAFSRASVSSSVAR